jgi:endonuclease/exonuclease/phosphatase family metal-dependent hydrolase
LKSNIDMPWMVFGDFNEILYSHEKEGGNQRPQNCMQAFRDALTDCELEDLGYSGNIFTWKRGRIRERLDRAIANEAWIIMHPGAVVQNLDYAHSNHRPIMVDTNFQTPSINRSTKPK